MKASHRYGLTFTMIRGLCSAAAMTSPEVGGRRVFSNPGRLRISTKTSLSLCSALDFELVLDF
jgi:hypothetical protein